MYFVGPNTLLPVSRVRLGSGVLRVAKGFREQSPKDEIKFRVETEPVADDRFRTSRARSDDPTRQRCLIWAILKRYVAKLRHPPATRVECRPYRHRRVCASEEGEEGEDGDRSGQRSGERRTKTGNGGTAWKTASLASRAASSAAARRPMATAEGSPERACRRRSLSRPRPPPPPSTAPPTPMCGRNSVTQPT